MKQSHMVAYVLQLPQVMGSNDWSQVPVLHIRRKYALYRLAHHRVQPVKGLVAEQVVRACAHAADNGDLFLHALGKCVYLPLLVKAEIFHQLVETRLVKSLVHLPVIMHHLLGSGIIKEVLFIRYIEKALLCRDILKYLMPVNGYASLVRLQHAAGQP